MVDHLIIIASLTTWQSHHNVAVQDNKLIPKINAIEELNL
jgi:hypothetical protein